MLGILFLFTSCFFAGILPSCRLTDSQTSRFPFHTGFLSLAKLSHDWPENTKKETLVSMCGISGADPGGDLWRLQPPYENLGELADSERMIAN